MELAIGWVESLGPQWVLDAGCGPGTAVAELARRLPDSKLVGLDLSLGMLQEASKLNRPSAVFLQGTALELPFKAGSFDLIVALGVLDYFPHHRAFFDNVRRVLRPQGHLIFTYPNGDSWTRGSRDLLRKATGRSGTAVRASPVRADPLFRMLTESGFELLEVRFITYGNGLVWLPWSAQLNRSMERWCRWPEMSRLLAWSCFCVARVSGG
jgi:SAM-dependent methyltransferase